jgi:hypothetical protein
MFFQTRVIPSREDGEGRSQSSKFQAPSSREYSNSKQQMPLRPLVFDVCRFSGAWMLELGVFGQSAFSSLTP